MEQNPETLKKQKIYLLVYGQLSELDSNPPLYLDALQNVLSAFEYTAQIICTTKYGSYLWQYNGWSKKKSTRKLACELSGKGYAGLLLFAENKNPPGFMCWLEYFVELQSEYFSVVKIINLILDKNSRKIFRVNNFEKNSDFMNQLLTDIFSKHR